MHTPTIPKDHIPRIGTRLDPPTPPIIEPLHVLDREVERISPVPAAGWHLGDVGVEEIVVELEGALEDFQAAVVRTVRKLDPSVVNTSHKRIIGEWDPRG
jgi:hypothetical protein